MPDAKGWISTLAAAGALGLAALIATVAPASECSTLHQVHWWTALPFFAAFLATGTYVVVVGSTAQRLLLFVATALAMAGYVAALSETLPMIFETEIGCAQDGSR